MDFINNMNKKIKVWEGSLDSPMKAAPEQIEKLKNSAPFKLPEDYIDFLLNTPDVVLASYIKDENEEHNGSTLNFYSMEELLERNEECESYKMNPEEDIFVIGDELGDLVLLYGEGKNGFGIYYCEESCLDFDTAEYVCDSITNMLINGKGLDTIYYG